MILFYVMKNNDFEKYFLKKDSNYNFLGELPLKDKDYISCCTFGQILDVASGFKNIKESICVLCINSNYLKPELKWQEDGKHKVSFPCIFGAINGSSIIDVLPLEKNDSGEFFISEKLFNYAKYEKSCGGIIAHKFEDGYKFLIIESIYKGNSIFGFPKGHMEVDETELETAAREIKEEVNLSVEFLPGFRANVYFSFKKGAILEVVFYAAKTNNIDVKPQDGEVEKCIWCTAVEAHNMLTFECDKNIFKKFLNFWYNNLK